MSDFLTERLRSVAFTIPTPFDESGDEIDHGALTENVEAIEEDGGRLIIPCGNTGEYYSLTHEERIEVVRTTVSATGDETAVVAGAGGSTQTVRTLLDAYERAGVDGAMIMYPRHTYMHRRGLEAYYRRIAESTDLDLILYKRGPELDDELLLDLTAEANVAGVKYAVDDVDGLSTTIEASDEDVVWMNGIAERFAPAFALEGAEGFTTGIGNFLTKEVLRLHDAIEREDWERALELRNLLRPYEQLRQEAGAGSTIGSANNVPAVKFGMELAGRHGGPVREPLVELSPDDKERAREYFSLVREHEAEPEEVN